MGIEIERKFLVDSIEYKDDVILVYKIKQGYIYNKDTIIRVRIMYDIYDYKSGKGGKDTAFLTIKGKTEGISKLEFEYEIPVDDAFTMITNLCHGKVIEKERRVVIFNDRKWEIDVFIGANNGLVIAEVELTSDQEQILLPPWVSEEISNDFKYSNSELINNPYSMWPNWDIFKKKEK